MALLMKDVDMDDDEDGEEKEEPKEEEVPEAEESEPESEESEESEAESGAESEASESEPEVILNSFLKTLKVTKITFNPFRMPPPKRRKITLHHVLRVTKDVYQHLKREIIYYKQMSSDFMMKLTKQENYQQLYKRI